MTQTHRGLRPARTHLDRLRGAGGGAQRGGRRGLGRRGYAPAAKRVSGSTGWLAGSPFVHPFTPLIDGGHSLPFPPCIGGLIPCHRWTASILSFVCRALKPPSLNWYHAVHVKPLPQPPSLMAHTHSTPRTMRKPTPFVVRCAGGLHAKGETTGFMYLGGWRGPL